jgi:hypothetical protein
VEIATRTIESTAKAAKEYGKEILRNTKVQAKAEVKLTEELGAEFNVKGVGGAGAAIQQSEASFTSESNLHLDGSFDTKAETESNKDITYRARGQVGGNGASGEYTIGEDGSYSSKGEITTSTGVLGVQTESSLKLGNKETEIASGVAIGVKTPIAASTNGFFVHLSIGASLKLVYQKKEE